MDRNRDLSKQLARLETKIQEQLDLDYARHGITLVPDNKHQSAALTGSFYGVKADNTGTKLVLATVIVDGVSLTNVDIAAGDVFYGNITSVLIGSGGTCQAIVLHKKGHGPTLLATTS